MTEEEFNGKLEVLEIHVIDALAPNINNIYSAIESLKSEIRKEREDLVNKLTKAEAKLKIYEAMFEKLNLNIELNNKEE